MVQNCLAGVHSGGGPFFIKKSVPGGGGGEPILGGSIFLPVNYTGNCYLRQFFLQQACGNSSIHLFVSGHGLLNHSMFRLISVENGFKYSLSF